MSTSLYTPLQYNEIRLVKILPSNDFSSTVNATCYTTSFAPGHAIENFTALSYTWGPSNNTSYIIVNGFKQFITPNLESALRHLRRTKEELVLWIDVICINQTDILEKDSQFQIMPDIYKRAETTIAWLGEESEYSSLALRVISEWASFASYASWRNTGEKLKLEPRGIFTDVAVTAMEELLQRPYWDRVWIQQEVALPRNLLLQCGHQHVRFDADSITSTEPKNIKDLSTIPFTIKFQKLLNVAKFRQEHHKPPSECRLLDILRRCIPLKTTDPRDRIYALLGLSHLEKYRLQLRPSYSKSVSQVFSEVAHVLIEEENSLFPIVLAHQTRLLKDQEISLPSWVPDWSLEVDGTLNLMSEERTLVEQQARAHISNYVRFSADSQVLSVRGLDLDEVSFVEPTWTISSLMAGKLGPAIIGKVLPNGFTVVEAVFRILTSLERCYDTSPLYCQEARSPKYALQVFAYLTLLNPEDAFNNVARIFGFDRTGLRNKVLEMFRDDEHLGDNLRKVVEDFAQSCLMLLEKRVFFHTKNGTLGISSQGVAPGDVIVHLVGYFGEIILRKNENHYRLIGDARVIRESLPPISDDSWKTVEIH